MSKIEVFFDHTCPYCKTGVEYLEELLPDYSNAQIVWYPVEAHPKIEEPEHRPWQNLCVQAALCVREQGIPELLYHNRLFKAQFIDGLDVESSEILANCAEEVGADKEKVLEALKSGKYEKEQLANNDYAYEKKDVWAVPTFVADSKRLDAVGGVGVTKAQVKELLEACCK